MKQRKPDCGTKWDPAAYAAAIERDDVEMLLWLKKESGIDPSDFPYIVETEASRLGSLKILKWLKADGGRLDHGRISARAAEGGHVHVLEWLLHEEQKLDNDAAMRGAGRANQKAVLKWMANTAHIPLDHGASAGAAAGGHVALLEWLREHECPFDEWCYEAAIRNRHLHVLKWLKRWRGKEDRGGIHGLHITTAAHERQWDVVRWLIKNGLPRTPELLPIAVKSGSWSVLQMLLKHGCELSDTISLEPLPDIIRLNGDFDVVKWVVEQKATPPPDQDACRSAARYGHLEILQWLLERGTPYDATACTSAAA